MMHEKVWLNYQEKQGDAPDKYYFKYTCVECFKKERGLTTEQAKAEICRRIHPQSLRVHTYRTILYLEHHSCVPFYFGILHTYRSNARHCAAYIVCTHGNRTHLCAGTRQRPDFARVMERANRYKANRENIKASFPMMTNKKVVRDLVRDTLNEVLQPLVEYICKKNAQLYAYGVGTCHRRHLMIVGVRHHSAQTHRP